MILQPADWFVEGGGGGGKRGGGGGVSMCRHFQRTWLVIPLAPEQHNTPTDRHLALCCASLVSFNRSFVLRANSYM